MTSHELARRLLELPDLPVATHANNHTYMSGIDGMSHGPVKIGKLHTYGGDHIIVGNFYKEAINPPNWYVTKTYDTHAPLPAAQGAEEEGGAA